MTHLSAYLHKLPVSKLPDDGKPVVVSFPKAGRTWLRVMLDEMGIPAYYEHDRTNHTKKAHWKSLNPNKKPYAKRKIVFLARDPRDTAVSGFFQATLRVNNYQGTIADFIRDPHHGIYKICYFQGQWEKAGPKLPQYMAIKYEDIHADGYGTLSSIYEFLTGKPPEKDLLEKAMAAGKFDVMKEREKSGFYAEKYGGVLSLDEKKAGDPEAAKTRRGKVGGYVDYLSAEDIAYCAQVMKETGYAFGYGKNE